jgi:hypothetical protein
VTLGAAFYLIVSVIAIGMILIVYGTIFKTRWGINAAASVECPRCHHVRGQIRKPTNLRQFLWGGGTCPSCGLEVDKWNRPVSSPR